MSSWSWHTSDSRSDLVEAIFGQRAICLHGPAPIATTVIIAPSLCVRWGAMCHGISAGRSRNGTLAITGRLPSREVSNLGVDRRALRVSNWVS